MAKAKEHNEAQAPAPREHGELVAMTKNGETIAVHQTCVDAHKRAGWAEA